MKIKPSRIFTRICRVLLATAVVFAVMIFSPNSRAAAGAATNQPPQKDSVIKTSRDALENGRKFLKNGKYRQAIKYYDIILTKFKEEKKEAAWALYERSYCYFKLGKKEMAVKGFESVRTLYPDQTGPVVLAEKMIAKISTAN
jgi:outer membrane protein assembly factor BamD (BamD/ComL family)